jgi:hypothetical protein
MEPYASVEDYHNLTGKTDTASDAQIYIDLSAISRYLDGKLGRYFCKDSADTTRLYLPDRAIATLYIEDVVSVTEVALEYSDGFEAITDYLLLPLNADKQPEPRPFNAIKLRNSTFPADYQVRVTGIHGWPAIPDAIQRATLHLAAILRIESPRATRRVSELGDVMEASPDAMSIIRQLTDRYRRVSYV